MVNPQLVSYIENQLRKGFQPQQVRTYLVNYGYTAIDVDDALKTAATSRMDSLVGYIKGELEKGTAPHFLRTQLIQYGYTSDEVDSAIGAAQSKPVGAIIFLIFAALIVVGLVWFFAFREVPPAYNDSGSSDSPASDITKPRVPKEPEVVEPEPIIPKEPVIKPEPIIPDAPQVVEPKIPPANVSRVTAPARLGGKYNEETIRITAENCAKMANQVYADACYAQVAKAAKDEIYCEKITREKTRDDCYIRFVIELENYALCDKISEEQLKEYCKDIPI